MNLEALLTGTTRVALIARAHKLCVEIDRASAGGRGCLLATVPGEQRDRILWWLRQRKLRGVFHVRRAAGCTRSVVVVVPGPRPAREHKRHGTLRDVEVAHAPIAGAKTVRPHSEVELLLFAVREGYRLVVAAVERFGRRHHPRGLGGRVGKASVYVSGAGEGHNFLAGAGIAFSRAVFTGEGAVGAWLQREHLPAFVGSVVARCGAEA